MTDKIFSPVSFISPSLKFNVASCCCSQNDHPQAASFFEGGGERLSSSLLDMKFTLFLFVILNLRGVEATFATYWRKKSKKTPKPCHPKDINISSK